jgi:hypothetical protein
MGQVFASGNASRISERLPDEVEGRDHSPTRPSPSRALIGAVGWSTPIRATRCVWMRCATSGGLATRCRGTGADDGRFGFSAALSTAPGRGRGRGARAARGSGNESAQPRRRRPGPFRERSSASGLAGAPAGARVRVRARVRRRAAGRDLWCTTRSVARNRSHQPSAVHTVMDSGMAGFSRRGLACGTTRQPPTAEVSAACPRCSLLCADWPRLGLGGVAGRGRRWSGQRQRGRRTPRCCARPADRGLRDEPPGGG